MLKGRLGLEQARVPHADRHGMIWLDRGNLTVEDGCLRFVTAGGALEAGDYRIPHQSVSIVLLGPGSTVSHDALRLMARHGTAMAAVGEDGVRCYTAPPLGPDRSDLARNQAMLWADPKKRLNVARRMYAWRLGEVLPHRDIAVLRGIEGSRMKESYKLVAERFGFRWAGRRYDRAKPDATDEANQAINHAATAVQAAAAIAVCAVSALPQLGFIHEDSDQSFVLDIADLFRDSITLPIAFAVAKEAQTNDRDPIDRLVRRHAARAFRKTDLIPSMLDRVKAILGDEQPGHPP
jgi:CRISPR-associated protein Cas1